jgi:hypothetical protein
LLQPLQTIDSTLEAFLPGFLLGPSWITGLSLLKGYILCRDSAANTASLWRAVTTKLRSVTPLGDAARLRLVKALAEETDLPASLPSADLDELAVEWVQDILHVAAEGAAAEADVVMTLIDHPGMSRVHFFDIVEVNGLH